LGVASAAQGDISVSRVTDVSLGQPSGDPRRLIDLNGTVYFSADDATNGRELWKSDSTAAGTKLVKDVNPNAATSKPSLLTEFKDALFFWADDGTHSKELWRSDGTPDGTTRLTNIPITATPSVPPSSRVASLTAEPSGSAVEAAKRSSRQQRGVQIAPPASPTPLQK
jgi:ELWxxDGT repeat protein